MSPPPSHSKMWALISSHNNVTITLDSLQPVTQPRHITELVHACKGGNTRGTVQWCKEVCGMLLHTTLKFEMAMNTSRNRLSYHKSRLNSYICIEQNWRDGNSIIEPWHSVLITQIKSLSNSETIQLYRSHQFGNNMKMWNPFNNLEIERA